MPNKKQLYAEMFEQTAERVTKSLSDWTGFLDVMGKLYKYPFHEQLMIYAQRPDATACAEYGLWNNKPNRHTKKKKQHHQKVRKRRDDNVFYG